MRARFPDVSPSQRFSRPRWHTTPVTPPRLTVVFLATLCYHSQTKLIKPLRLLLGQHFTHLTLFQKPSEILCFTIYTPPYLRIVDQCKYFVCCGLEYIITILKFFEVSKEVFRCFITGPLWPSLTNFNLGISSISSTRLWDKKLLTFPVQWRRSLSQFSTVLSSTIIV